MLSNIDAYYLTLEEEEEDTSEEEEEDASELDLDDKYISIILDLKRNFDRERCIDLLYELKDINIYTDYANKDEIFEYALEIMAIIFDNKETFTPKESDDLLLPYLKSDGDDVLSYMYFANNIEAINNFARELSYHVESNDNDHNDILKLYVRYVCDYIHEGIDKNIIADALYTMYSYL